MTQEQTFAQLLESSEGLTEDFKTAAASLFEQAVAEEVEARVSEKLDEMHEIVAEQGAQIIEEQIAEQVEAAKYEIKEQYQGEIASLVEQLASAEDKAVQLTEQYEGQVGTLTESMEHRAAELAASEVEKLSESLDRYLTYVAEKYVEEHKVPLIEAQKAWIGQSFMGELKSLFEKFNIEEPNGTASLHEQIADLEKERDDVYAQLAEQLEVKAELENQITESRKATIVAVATEHLTEADRLKVADLMEGFEGDLDTFKSRVQLLAEGFVEQEQQEVLEEETKLEIGTVDIVSEQAPVETPVETKAEQLDEDVEWFVKALESYSRK
jgi:hypothetical protein